MPLNALPDDFYDYDEQAQMLDGRHNGWQFVVGMHVRVKVTEVTPVSGGILLEWVEGGLQSETFAKEKGKTRKKTLEKSGRGARGRGTNGRNARRAWQKVANEKDDDLLDI